MVENSKRKKTLLHSKFDRRPGELWKLAQRLLVAHLPTLRGDQSLLARGYAVEVLDLLLQRLHGVRRQHVSVAGVFRTENQITIVQPRKR